MLSTGSAACAATNAPVGNDSVTASYSGDTNFAADGSGPRSPWPRPPPPPTSASCRHPTPMGHPSPGHRDDLVRWWHAQRVRRGDDRRSEPVHCHLEQWHGIVHVFSRASRERHHHGRLWGGYEFRHLVEHRLPGCVGGDEWHRHHRHALDHAARGLGELHGHGHLGRWDTDRQCGRHHRCHLTVHGQLRSAGTGSCSATNEALEGSDGILGNIRRGRQLQRLDRDGNAQCHQGRPRSPQVRCSRAPPKSANPVTFSASVTSAATPLVGQPTGSVTFTTSGEWCSCARRHSQQGARRAPVQRPPRPRQRHRLLRREHAVFTASSSAPLPLERGPEHSGRAQWRHSIERRHER